MRGSLILPEFVLKTKGSRFGTMLLDEERGRHGPPAIEGVGSAASIEGAGAPYGRKVRQPLKGCALTKIGFANASIPSPFPSKKRTSHERFVNTSEVRSEKPQLPRFGAMLLDEERGGAARTAGH